MDSIIIFCAQYLIFVIVALAFIFWLTVTKQKKIDIIIFGLITAIVALILAKIGNILINDPRPMVTDHLTPLLAHAADNGFPSDHTLLSASLAFAVMLVSKRWGTALLVLAVVVGISRVLAHVHHPIDIIGSLIFAVTGSAVAYFTGPKLSRAIADKLASKREA